MGLLDSLSVKDELTAFLLDFNRESIEQQLWEVWLAKDFEEDFETFKKRVFKKSIHKQGISKAEEEAIMQKAEGILSMTRKGG